MAVNPMLNIGANAIAQGMKSLDSVAQEIAELNITNNPSVSAGDGEPVGSFSLNDSGPGDMASAIVDLKVYQRQIQAAATIVETADEVIGFLLDVRA